MCKYTPVLLGLGLGLGLLNERKRERAGWGLAAAIENAYSVFCRMRPHLCPFVAQLLGMVGG